MIVVMEKNVSRDKVDHMVQRVEGLGLKAHVIVGAERTVIAVVGEEREMVKESLESGPGVAEVHPILAPYKVASRERPGKAVVKAPKQPSRAGLPMKAGSATILGSRRATDKKSKARS